MDWMLVLTIAGAVVGIAGGIAGIWSVVLAQKQWNKVRKKIAVLSTSEEIYEVLPAWYTSRMVDERWMFGLYTASGHTLLIRRIMSLSDDSKWMNVELATAEDAKGLEVKNSVAAVADDRTKASVQISGIVAAVDLWSS